MARRTTTYAIRLAVEGGGQVKAELVSVSQSGEQSLKRIETAGERASGGLKGLGRQAELLRTGIRTLGGALIGAATVGGLGVRWSRDSSSEKELEPCAMPSPTRNGRSSGRSYRANLVASRASMIDVFSTVSSGPCGPQDP